MRLKVELTDSQVIALRQQVRTTKEARVLRRAIALIELSRGRPWWELTGLLEISLRSLYRWVEALEHRTMEAATGEKVPIDRGGHPTRWDEELDEFLEALLSHRPDQLGWSQLNWSVPLFRAHLMHWCGENFSDDTIRRRLHALGYVWKRPRYVLLPDPKKDKIMAEIQSKIRCLNPQKILLCIDETDLLLCPPLRSTWAERGTSGQVQISGWNEKRVIFGALNITTGNLILLQRDHHQAIDFHVFLHMIRSRYRGWNIIALLDGHPSHTAATTEVLARVLGIEFWWLPKRSPEMNPVDALWGKAKDVLCANRQFEDIDDQSDGFINQLLDLPKSEILRLSGLQSSGHWLTNL